MADLSRLQICSGAGDARAPAGCGPQTQCLAGERCRAAGAGTTKLRGAGPGRAKPGREEIVKAVPTGTAGAAGLHTHTQIDFQSIGRGADDERAPRLNAWPVEIAGRPGLEQRGRAARGRGGRRQKEKRS